MFAGSKVVFHCGMAAQRSTLAVARLDPPAPEEPSNFVREAVTLQRPQVDGVRRDMYIREERVLDDRSRRYAEVDASTSEAVRLPYCQLW